MEKILNRIPIVDSTDGRIATLKGTLIGVSKVISSCIKATGKNTGIVFCDVGCSDGRVLLMAAEREEISHVYGIELSKDGKKAFDDLCEKADVPLKIKNKITYYTGDAFAFDENCFYSSVDVLYAYDPIWQVFSIGLRSILYNFKNIKVLAYAATMLKDFNGYDLIEPAHLLIASNKAINDARETGETDKNVVVLNGPLFAYEKGNIICYDVDFSNEFKHHQSFDLEEKDVDSKVHLIIAKRKKIVKKGELVEHPFKENEQMKKITDKIYPLIYPHTPKDAAALFGPVDFATIYSVAMTEDDINLLLEYLDEDQLFQIAKQIINREEEIIIPEKEEEKEEEEEIIQNKKKLRRIIPTKVEVANVLNQMNNEDTPPPSSTCIII
jgi:SAM-dependent methyltransferase